MISINTKDAAEISGILETAYKSLEQKIKIKVKTIQTMERNRDKEIKDIQRKSDIDIEMANFSFDKALDMYKTEVIQLQQLKNKTKDYMNIMKFGSLDDVKTPVVDLTF